MIRNPRGLFITGTDTDVGKTYVTALIAKTLQSKGVRVGVYKPTASGCRNENGRLVSDDALALWEAAGRPGELEAVCPQRFAAPLAPHLAAHAEGKRVDRMFLRDGAKFWRERCDFLIVEGAGGLLSPISDDDFNRDLARDLGYPLVIVAANRIGAINQVAQTVVAWEAIASGIPIAGIVLNDVVDPQIHHDSSRLSNRPQIESWTKQRVLTTLGFQAESFSESIDWQGLASCG